jgi:hypothetical protein
MGLGSIVGDVFGIGGDGGAGGTLGESSALFDKLKIPDIEDQKLKLEELIQQGVITPEQAQTYLQGDTGLKEISADPRLKNAQMASLSALQDISEGGGLTMTDKAKLAKIQADNASAEKGSREAILQNAKMRGVGGSGLELGAQMINQQGSATRRNQEGLDVAAQAEQRALEALMNSGQLAGQVRGQDFGEQSQVAQAQDSIDRFNAQNRQAVQEANIGRRTTANEQNLANRQRVADTNVATHNQEQQFNKGLPQQQFTNELSKATGKAGALNNVAQLQNSQAARQDQFLGGLIGAGGTIGAGAMIASDERSKTDIQDGDMDLESFLESLDPKKYKYKDPERFGEGDHVSVMAQDLEKTPMGRDAVKQDVDGTKLVDYAKLLPEIVAALGHLNKKVEGRA